MNPPKDTVSLAWAVWFLPHPPSKCWVFSHSPSCSVSALSNICRCSLIPSYSRCSFPTLHLYQASGNKNSDFFFSCGQPGYYKVGRGQTQSLMSSHGDHLWHLPSSHADTFEDRGFTQSSPTRIQTCAECISPRCRCCILEDSPHLSQGTWRFIHVLCERSQRYSYNSVCKGRGGAGQKGCAVLRRFGGSSRSQKCFTSQTSASIWAGSL